MKILRLCLTCGGIYEVTIVGKGAERDIEHIVLDFCPDHKKTRDLVFIQKMPTGKQ